MHRFCVRCMQPAFVLQYTQEDLHKHERSGCAPAGRSGRIVRTMDMQTIGDVIAALRKEKGVTQEELGRFAGVSTQAVSKWECGGLPDTELLPRIAEFFGVSVDRLFGRNASDASDMEAAAASDSASNSEWYLDHSLLGS